MNVKGLDAMIDSLRELQTEGVRRAQAELDRALDRTAETSRDLAHLHQGDLKASQQVSSAHGLASWEGQISYSARGAQYEYQKPGHGAFIDDLSRLSAEDFERALDAMFRDR